MKKVLAVLILLSVFSFSGCFAFLGSVELTTLPDAQETTDIVITELAETSVPDIQLTSEYEASDIYETESVAEYESTSEYETSTEVESQIKPQENSSEPEKTTTSQPMTEVELGITMPEKNGTMVVDTSASNKFIKIVEGKKHIDSGLLAAVFSVPDSGQNYVFEFYDESGRGVDDIRRVYLIDTKGEITGIAAVKASEKENISSVENWFCMNVLIKELVYPAVRDELN